MVKRDGHLSDGPVNRFAELPQRGTLYLPRFTWYHRCLIYSILRSQGTAWIEPQA